MGDVMKNRTNLKSLFDGMIEKAEGWGLQLDKSQKGILWSSLKVSEVEAKVIVIKRMKA